MLNTLKKLFPTHPIDSSAEQDTLTLSAVVLMIEVLSSDSVVDEREVQHVLTLMSQNLKVPNDEVQTLYDSAQQQGENAISLQGFTHEICQHYDNMQRIELLAMLWEVALIDNELDAHERHLIRKIAALLYLNDKQIIQAKELAKKNLV